MPSLDDFRVDEKFKLAKVDPDATPFADGKADKQREELDELASKLDVLQNLLHAEGKRKLLLVLQGTDTSGKDGTVRWVFSRTSPLGVRVAAFKAPTPEELAHDFLWRCHAKVPGAGQISVWNRSHYEDVLVPVVEGWIDKEITRQRYGHINDFERLLTDNGTTVLKCMLHIGKDEQRGRLQDRIDETDKNWKFNMGDLEARKKWDAYQEAYEDALRATSTKDAPWYVVPANSKKHRNLMIAKLLIRTLESMNPKAPPAVPALKGLVVE